MRTLLLGVLAVELMSCAHAPPALQLAESWPLETSLDHADIVDAAPAWLELIGGAMRSLDVGEFYISTAAQDGHPGLDDRLEPVLVAIEQAAARGVAVRVLVDESFYAKYPRSVERLGAHANVSVRRIDWKAHSGGGVMHAKYFVVDGVRAYLGSQNFDYRSLSHIHEVGAVVRDVGVVQQLAAIFARDFAVAGGDAAGTAKVGAADDAQVTFAASPQNDLPEGVAFELDGLVQRLDAAKRSIEVQVLTYKIKQRDGSPFTVLDEALRRAAARGVKVTLIVSSWGQKDGSVAALSALPNMVVKVITIPAWSKSELQFARVAHSKYCLIDREVAWVGTSNWEGDYFLKSRNVSVFSTEPGFVGDVAKVFDTVLHSPLTVPLEASATAQP